MNIGSSYRQSAAQNLYAPKRNAPAASNGKEANEFLGCTKTMRLKNENKIIKFDPCTLEIKEIIAPKDEEKQDPVYKKLKEAGLIDDGEKKKKTMKTCDENLINAIHWHYENLLAIKKARETVIKIEEDQLEELFRHMEHNTGDELSTEGVTAEAKTRVDSEADTEENLKEETEEDMREEA